MPKYTIRICNYSFTISSDDDKNYMDNVAAKVERRVKRLSDEMPSRNMTEVALFVAMDYCDQYMKSVGDGSNLRGQIKDYLQESGYARQELEEAKKENEQLKAEIEALRSRLSVQNNAAAPVSTSKPVQPKTAEKQPVIENRPARQAAHTSNSNNDAAAIQGLFSEDAYAESADATAEIMSFFEQKAFDEDDD
ncbi:MAG: cell division protein ZapA [Clostridia bacterium]|nr:cell division protein ZapA [Clostridia bacterium]